MEALATSNGLTAYQSVLVQSFDDLSAIAPAWDALAQHTGHAMPFVRFEWLRACAQERPRRMEPYVVIVKQGEKIRAIGPFARLGRMPGRRRIVFLGMGPSDYQTVLSTGQDRLTERVWEALLSRDDWDWIELDPLSEADAHTLEPIVAAHPSLRCEFIPKGICPVVDLSHDSFMSSEAARGARYEWRRLERQGPVEIRRVSSAGELEEFLDGLFTLHQRRWGPSRAVSRFADYPSRRWFVRLAQAWQQTGLLDAQGLYVNNYLIAAHVGAVTPERFYYHTPVFDADYSKHSPGKVLLWRLLEDCRNNGVQIFDFLRGEENYKRSWGAAEGVRFGRFRIVRRAAGLRQLPAAFDRAGAIISRSVWLRRMSALVKGWLGE